MRHSLLFAADEGVRGCQLVCVHAYPLDDLSLIRLSDLAHELDHFVHCKVNGACLQVVHPVTKFGKIDSYHEMLHEIYAVVHLEHVTVRVIVRVVCVFIDWRLLLDQLKNLLHAVLRVCCHFLTNYYYLVG